MGERIRQVFAYERTNAIRHAPRLRPPDAAGVVVIRLRSVHDEPVSLFDPSQILSLVKERTAISPRLSTPPPTPPLLLDLYAGESQSISSLPTANNDGQCTRGVEGKTGSWAWEIRTTRTGRCWLMPSSPRGSFKWRAAVVTPLCSAVSERLMCIGVMAV